MRQQRERPARSGFDFLPGTQTGVPCRQTSQARQRPQRSGETVTLEPCQLSPRFKAQEEPGSNGGLTGMEPSGVAQQSVGRSEQFRAGGE